MAKRKGKRSRARDGVRRYEFPYGVSAPALVSHDLDIAAWRRVPEESYRMNVTLLDAPDYRLIRSGVQLAHRVIDSVGEWYLSAPGWAPHLPAERTVAMDDADLPVELAELTRPFRRSAPLGPTAAMNCKRALFVGVDGDGAEIARLRDERITVRRGGLTTGRYREITLEPGSAATAPRLRWLHETLQAGGALPVETFPSLPERLGAPATGLSDLPEPRRWRASDSLESVVSALFLRRLHMLTAADLALRTGAAPRRADCSPCCAGCAPICAGWRPCSSRAGWRRSSPTSTRCWRPKALSRPRQRSEITTSPSSTSSSRRRGHRAWATWLSGRRAA